jgi:hypothetical protein
MDQDARGPAIEGLYESLDLPGHRVELLEGRIVVSPAPIKLRSRIVTWLSDSLREVCAERGWDRLTGTVDLPATSERIQPDLFVCPADESTDGEWLVPAKNVLLAAEVVSPSSRRDDYEVKRILCTQRRPDLPGHRPPGVDDHDVRGPEPAGLPPVRGPCLRRQARPAGAVRHHPRHDHDAARSREPGRSRPAASMTTAQASFGEPARAEGGATPQHRVRRSARPGVLRIWRWWSGPVAAEGEVPRDQVPGAVRVGGEVVRAPFEDFLAVGRAAGPHQAALQVARRHVLP